jgi:hypothetical protein
VSLEAESVEAKLSCLIQTQENILEKVAAVETEATLRGTRMAKHIVNYQKHTIEDKATLKEIRSLAALIHEVHSKQTILLEERQNSIDFWRSMKEKIATTGIMGTLGLLGTALWYAAQQFFLHGPRG